MYIWEIPLTVSSCFFSLIWLAFGANVCAYFMTFSGNVAEKSRICTSFGSILWAWSAFYATFGMTDAKKPTA